MADRDLSLNSLSRYSKRSPDMVLEERGHCEIPAGCGGVVLRWWNPKQGMPVTTWVHSSGGIEAWLDGRRLIYGVPLVTFGRHVLAFAITRVAAGQVAVMVAVVREASVVAEPDPRTVVVRSVPDGSWRYSRIAPSGDAWTQPDFDDSGWDAMELGVVPAGGATESSTVTRVERFGAQALTGGGAGTSMWVRKPFVLSPAGDAGGRR